MKKFIRFSKLGGVGTTINLAAVYSSKFFGLQDITSLLIGETINYIISFYVHKYWTFEEKQKEKTPKEMFIYALVIGIHFVGSLEIVQLEEYLIIHFWIGFLAGYPNLRFLIYRAIAMLVLTAPYYMATEKLVFRKEVKKPDDA